MQSALAVASAMFVVALGVSSLSAQTQGGGPASQGRAGGPGARATAPTSPVTGNATNGKKLYYDYSCYGCHGFNGETGARPFVPNWTPMLATEGSFTTFLRGRAELSPATPSTAMPNYSVQSLSDAQARDIYAFIRTFKGTQPTTEQIPTFAEILKAAQRPYKP